MPSRTGRMLKTSEDPNHPAHFSRLLPPPPPTSFLNGQLGGNSHTRFMNDEMVDVMLTVFTQIKPRRQLNVRV